MSAENERKIFKRYDPQLTPIPDRGRHLNEHDEECIREIISREPVRNVVIFPNARVMKKKVSGRHSIDIYLISGDDEKGSVYYEDNDTANLKKVLQMASLHKDEGSINRTPKYLWSSVFLLPNGASGGDDTSTEQDGYTDEAEPSEIEILEIKVMEEVGFYD